MTAMRQAIMVLVLGAVLGWAAVASGGPTAAQKCEAAKLKAAGKKEACLASEKAKEVLGGAPDFAKCSDKFAGDFAKAEAKAGPGVCVTEGDAAAIEARIDAAFDRLVAALEGSPTLRVFITSAVMRRTGWPPAGTSGSTARRWPTASPT